MIDGNLFRFALCRCFSMCVLSEALTVNNKTVSMYFDLKKLIIAQTLLSLKAFLIGNFKNDIKHTKLGIKTTVEIEIN